MEDYKKRLIILREWKRESSSSDAFKNINSVMSNNFISKDEVNDLYNQFNQGDIGIFCDDSDFYVSQQFNGDSKNLHSSLISISNDEQINGKMLTKDGRFLFFPDYCLDMKKSSITVYDLFKSTKRTTFVPFKISYASLAFVDEYLLIVTNMPYGERCKIHVFKIDYSNLNVEEKFRKELGTIMGLDCFEIIPDQLENENFVILNDRKIMMGEIQNDQIVVGNSKDFHSLGYKICGKRLIGNLLQAFVYAYDANFVEFWELNFGTMEMKKTKVRIDLIHNKWVKLGFQSSSYSHCWKNDCLYKMFKIKNSQYKLLMFDSVKLKWSDMQISAKNVKNLFVDENETLTIQAGTPKKFYGFCRVNLRKPETLEILTQLAAVREANLYGNNKYVRISRQIQI